jgi:hypothetical protein
MWIVFLLLLRNVSFPFLAGVDPRTAHSPLICRGQMVTGMLQLFVDHVSIVFRGRIRGFRVGINVTDGIADQTAE